VPLTLLVRRAGDEAVLAARGAIDLATVDQLRAEVDALVDGDAPAVVLDLGDVSLLDSVGISALLACRRLADQHGRSFRVTGATGLVREVLDITGVWNHLTEPAGGDDHA